MDFPLNTMMILTDNDDIYKPTNKGDIFRYLDDKSEYLVLFGSDYSKNGFINIEVGNHKIGKRYHLERVYKNKKKKFKARKKELYVIGVMRIDRHYHSELNNLPIYTNKGYTHYPPSPNVQTFSIFNRIGKYWLFEKHKQMLTYNVWDGNAVRKIKM